MFYVYSYLRENGTPYYIGKGSGNRAYRKRRKGVKPPADTNRIKILYEYEVESEAFQKEIELIDNSIGNLSINLGEFIESQDGYQGSDNTIYNSFKSTIMKKLENGVLEDIIENLIGDDFNGDVKVGKIRNYQIFYWG